MATTPKLNQRVRVHRRHWLRPGSAGVIREFKAPYGWLIEFDDPYEGGGFYLEPRIATLNVDRTKQYLVLDSQEFELLYD